ncbi:MAG: hypothetical protein LBC40_02095 [Dysgonamonadaceae bacterium]|nr:hypothetical protein [Dysgonamonadaceae bacterium]
MMDTPNDKPQKTDAFEDPKLYVVVGDEVFPRTGLETALVDFPDANTNNVNAATVHSDTIAVGGIVCSCNKVRVRSVRYTSDCGGYGCPCVSHRIGCSCVGNTCSCVGNTCSCVGYSTGRSGSGCRCAPVH